MSLPTAAVPLPGGRPLPSGITSMSMAFSSSAVGGRPTPNPGDCAAARVALQRMVMASASRLRAIAIGHLAVARDPPHLNAVVVVLRVGAAHVNQLGKRRLGVPGFVGAPRCKV